MISYADPFAITGENIKRRLLIQEERYFLAFRVILDFTEISVPSPPSTIDPRHLCLEVMPEGFGPDKYWEASRELFPCHSNLSGLDTVFRNDRGWERTYAFWTEAKREGDRSLCNMSAQELSARGINVMTLAQRLWLGLDWFLAIREHLDVSEDYFMHTHCLGSQDSEGVAPFVYALGNRVRLGRRLSAKDSYNLCPRVVFL